MQRYVIERNIPGAGKLGPAELAAVTRKSCDVLRELGPRIQWVTSYVTGDRVYCVYYAEDEEVLRQHAELGGFPADRISAVTAMMDPTSGG
jgi:hypothetical protein